VTRRLTLLHVLWDDRDDPEPDWAARLRLAGVAAERGVVSSEIVVPYGFRVNVLPGGRIELVPEEPATPPMVETSGDSFHFTTFVTEVEAAMKRANELRVVGSFTSPPRALREWTPEEIETFRNPACSCPRWRNIVSPVPTCPVLHAFHEDPQPTEPVKRVWLNDSQVRDVPLAGLLRLRGIDPEQPYDTEATWTGVWITQPSQVAEPEASPAEQVCTCYRGLRNPECPVEHGPICTCNGYFAVDPECPAHGRQVFR
jgi:hypothetical protein